MIVRGFAKKRMTLQERKQALEIITNPPAGSRLAAAKEYGIDLTLLLESLARTPTERARRLMAAAASVEELRRAGQRHRG
jgi:phage baseplate assembly protein W